MQTGACVVMTPEELTKAVAASSGLPSEVVREGWEWLNIAMISSRFNMYHQLDAVVRHIRLAISVPQDDLMFSLEAHGFEPLPQGANMTSLTAAIKAILEDSETLASVVENLPTT